MRDRYRLPRPLTLGIAKTTQGTRKKVTACGIRTVNHKGASRRMRSEGGEPVTGNRPDRRSSETVIDFTQGADHAIIRLQRPASGASTTMIGKGFQFLPLLILGEAFGANTYLVPIEITRTSSARACATSIQATTTCDRIIQEICDDESHSARDFERLPNASVGAHPNNSCSSDAHAKGYNHFSVSGITISVGGGSEASTTPPLRTAPGTSSASASSQFTARFRLRFRSHVHISGSLAALRRSDSLLPEVVASAHVQLSGPRINVNKHVQTTFLQENANETFDEWVLLEAGDYELTTRADAAAIGYSTSDPEATFQFSLFADPIPTAVIMPIAIHGQLAEALYSNNVYPPLWYFDFYSAAIARFNEIDLARLRNDQPRLAFGLLYGTLPGDWARMTIPGFREIVTSRLLFLLSEINAVPPVYRVASFGLGWIAERMGARETARNSTKAAAEIAARITSTVEQLRSVLHSGPLFLPLQLPEDVPFYVDIVAHSRGGAVAGEVVRRLRAGPKCRNPVHVSVTYLDAIDPSPWDPDFLRPRAKAGWLVRDPEITTDGSTWVSNFYAERGLIGDTGEPMGESLFSNEFVDCLIRHFGAIADNWFVERGWPQGHSRPYLSPTLDVMVEGATHMAVPDLFVAALEDAVGGEPPNSSFSFLNTSYLGRYIQDPLSDTPEPRKTLDSPPPAREGLGSDDFLPEAAFEDVLGALERTIELLADPAVQSLIQECLPIAFEMLQDTLAAGFPSFGSWRASAQGVALARSDSGEAFAELSTGGSLMQEASFDARYETALVATVEYELVTPNAWLSAVLTGEGLNSQVTTGAASVSSARTTLILHGYRSGCSLPSAFDEIRLQGNGARVFRVSLAALEHIRGDANGNDIVDLADFREMASCWTGPGRFLAGPSPADADSDFDVDLVDFSTVQRAFAPESH